MQLKLRTDFALRVLLYLGHRANRVNHGRLDPGPVQTEALATAFDISKDHVIKVVQELARLGWVRTQPGRGGGIALATDLEQLTVADVVAAFEGRAGVLDCVADPSVCVLEPGCGLRRLLMRAEQAFYATLAEATLAELCATRGRRGGLLNLDLN